VSDSKSVAVVSAGKINPVYAGFVVPAILVATLAIALRAYDLGQPSLWNDELFSRYYADLFGLKYLWTTGLPREDSPPLYYMAVAGWMRLFGTSEAAMRSLSLVASVLALPLVYLIGKELFDRWRGLLAALIMALSPMQIHFAQEARTYALLLLPIGVALLAISRFLKGDMRHRVLWLYGAGAIVALYCHATAAFFLGACNIAVVIAIVTDRRIDRRKALTRWIVTNLIIGVAAIPELVAMALQGRHGAGLAWIPRFSLLDVVRGLTPIVSGTATPVRFPGVELALLLTAGVAGALVVASPGRRAWVVLVAIPMLFVAIIAAASVIQPIFIPRVFCWLSMPLALLLAHALATPWRLRPLVAGAAAAACLVGLFYHFTVPQKEPWREVFQDVGGQLAAARHVVLAPLTDPTGAAYYAPYLTRLQAWDLGLRGSVEHEDMPQRMGVQPISREQLVSEIGSGADVWLIVGATALPYVGSLLEDVPPPRVAAAHSCAKALCVAVLSWPGHPPRAITSASAP
jgi:4-amino-4-deoxy-L-arabinose transferase-like glycosyltransferase